MEERGGGGGVDTRVAERRGGSEEGFACSGVAVFQHLSFLAAGQWSTGLHTYL